LTEEFSLDRTIPAGTLALASNGVDEPICEMVLMNEWQSELSKLLTESS
jgi:hypothetical protein